MGKKILIAAGYDAAGCDVVTVSNGLEAAKKIAELHPDIALLDVYMPGYTGIELCEKIKLAAATAQMPVLLTVGKMEPFRSEEANKVKADGLVIKPFVVQKLLTVMGKLAQRVQPATSSPQTRCTASLLTPKAVASLRQLQCVEPSLGRLREAVSGQDIHPLWISTFFTAHNYWLLHLARHC
jgi:CheY-like chemotaxis protein